MQDVNSNTKILVALDYIFTPLLPIVFLLMEDKKNDPFIRSHNAQALAIGVIQFVLWSTSFACIPGILALILLVAQIYWAFKAYQGEQITIPVITDFVKNQGWA